MRAHAYQLVYFDPDPRWPGRWCLTGWLVPWRVAVGPARVCASRESHAIHGNSSPPAAPSLAPQATPDTTCLVVNHENMTWNYYRGRDRAFLLPGALFRLGGAAALLSNRRAPGCKEVETQPCHQGVQRGARQACAAAHTPPSIERL